MEAPAMTKPTTTKPFVPPSVEQVRAYAASRGYPQFDAKMFCDYYAAADWRDGQGSPVKNWKQKFIAVWEPKLGTRKTVVAATPSTNACCCGCGRSARIIVGNTPFASRDCRKKVLGW